MKEIKVGIDPGHGGSDPGAIGPTGLMEKDVALDVALQVMSLLEAEGIEVIPTRANDRYVTLQQRSDMLNAARVDLVVSIHCNSSSNPDAKYIACFIYGRGGKAEQAAKLLHEEIRKTTGWPGPAEADGIKVKNLHMVRETKAPAVVVEMCFISNAEQEYELRSPVTRAKVAKAIVAGICRYFGLPAPGDKTVHEIKHAPLNINGVTYVPLREFVGLLGGTVNWKGNDQPIEVLLNSYWLLIEVGRDQVVKSKL